MILISSQTGKDIEYWTDEEVGTVMSACIVLSMNSYHLFGKLIWQTLLTLHSLNLKIGWLCDNRGFKSCYAFILQLLKGMTQI